MLPLRVVLPQEQRLGHPRTKCGCPTCSVSCHYIPGFLIPDDLAAMAPVAAGEDAVLAWAFEHLLASPGAMAARLDPAAGQLIGTFRIPTLVPARQADGASCHWLGGDGLCAVHEHNPYGCGCADSHLSEQQGLAVSHDGLEAILRDRDAGGLYGRVWDALDAAGRRAPSPALSRERMRLETGDSYAPCAPDNPDVRVVALGEPYGPSAAASVRGLIASLAASAKFDRPEEPTRPIRHATVRVGRNAPCPCGSGAKAKACPCRRASRG